MCLFVKLGHREQSRVSRAERLGGRGGAAGPRLPPLALPGPGKNLPGSFDPAPTSPRCCPAPRPCPIALSPPRGKSDPQHPYGEGVIPGLDTPFPWLGRGSWMSPQATNHSVLRQSTPKVAREGFLKALSLTLTRSLLPLNAHIPGGLFFVFFFIVSQPGISSPTFPREVKLVVAGQKNTYRWPAQIFPV